MNTILVATRPGLRWLAAGLAVGLVVAALMGPAVGAVQGSEPEHTVRSISVNGTGRVKAEPDVASIQIGVTKQGEDAQAASEKAAIAMDAVIKSLIDSGIAEADIQTTSLNLSPVYNYNTDPAKIVGWQASNMVSVTVRDISAVGDVVDAATTAGATNVSGISFRVEDPTEAQAEARSAAVADAEAKALQLASDARVNIIGVITITESGGQPPQPLYLNRDLAFAAESIPSTPVLPGEVELSVNVSIQYEIE
ncbi:MAG: SIMPL domain-containing protein [Chloroflexota bacterium]